MAIAHQQFRSNLQALRPQLQDDRPSLAAALTHLQAQYHSQILPAPAPATDPLAARFQSLQTEIAKQMRLLSLDAMFLKTARQAEKRLDRLAQMQQRLDLLEKYCEAIEDLDPPHTGSPP
ncbi:MAG: heterocyst frequency control protein PatD [Prochlorothrix sp.]|nr:heterocyst frequency control protein PatD [Prochlorothrix sp.]